MGLNRISNSAKLRRLSERVGLPVIRAYSRWFENQNTLLAFTDEATAWIVPKTGDVERYDDMTVRLTDGGVRPQP